MENIESNCHPILSFSSLSLSLFCHLWKTFAVAIVTQVPIFQPSADFFAFLRFRFVSVCVFLFSFYFDHVTIPLRQGGLVYKNRESNTGDITY
jgi:hypothetical protein